jgi:hypothetical protein
VEDVPATGEGDPRHDVWAEEESWEKSVILCQEGYSVLFFLCGFLPLFNPLAITAPSSFFFHCDLIYNRLFFISFASHFLLVILWFVVLNVIWFITSRHGFINELFITLIDSQTCLPHWWWFNHILDFHVLVVLFVLFVGWND